MWVGCNLRAFYCCCFACCHRARIMTSHHSSGCQLARPHSTRLARHFLSDPFTLFTQVEVSFKPQCTSSELKDPVHNTCHILLAGVVPCPEPVDFPTRWTMRPHCGRGCETSLFSVYNVIAACSTTVVHESIGSQSASKHETLHPIGVGPYQSGVSVERAWVSMLIGIRTPFLV